MKKRIMKGTGFQLEVYISLSFERIYRKKM
jgi:hypothetical protein